MGIKENIEAELRKIVFDDIYPSILSEARAKLTDELADEAELKTDEMELDGEIEATRTEIVNQVFDIEYKGRAHAFRQEVESELDNLERQIKALIADEVSAMELFVRNQIIIARNELKEEINNQIKQILQSTKNDIIISVSADLKQVLRDSLTAEIAEIIRDIVKPAGQ